MSNRRSEQFEKLETSEIVMNCIPAILGVIVLVVLIINLAIYGEPVLLSQSLTRSYSSYFGSYWRYFFVNFGYTNTYLIFGIFLIFTSISCFFTSFSNHKKGKRSNL